MHAGETALDRYVAKSDPTYAWKVMRTLRGNETTQYIVDLISRRRGGANRRAIAPSGSTGPRSSNQPGRFQRLLYLRITGGANGEPPQTAEAAVSQHVARRRAQHLPAIDLGS